METPYRCRKAAVFPARARAGTRRLGVALAALALPLATGCSANFGAPTQQQYQPAAGSDDRSTDIYVLNALVVANDTGEGTLVTTLINQADCPDYLVDLQATNSDGGGVKTSRLPAAEPISGPDTCDDTAPDTGIALPSQRSAKLPEGGLVQFQADTVQPGTFMTLSMRFEQAGPIKIDVPVVAKDNEGNMYDGITVGPIATPTGGATTAGPTD